SVLTGTEVGLPLLPHDTAVLIETNVDAFAADIDVDASEVRIYLAAQELAHLALFERAPWLSAQVETVLTRYAQGLKVDTSQIDRKSVVQGESDEAGGAGHKTQKTETTE